MGLDADRVIFEAVWETLPNCQQSLLRSRLLALRQKLHRNHPARTNVQAQLALLASLEGLQSDLPFKNPEPK